MLNCPYASQAQQRWYHRRRFRWLRLAECAAAEAMVKLYSRIAHVSDDSAASRMMIQNSFRALNGLWSKLHEAEGRRDAVKPKIFQCPSPAQARRHCGVWRKSSDGDGHPSSFKPSTESTSRRPHHHGQHASAYSIRE